MSKPLNVVIARFQVHDLTPAHYDVLGQAGGRPLVVLLGVSPMDGKDHRHPLTFRQRAHMVEEGLKNWPSFLGSYPLFDQHSDQVWSNELDKFLEGMFPDYEPCLWGGRDSFIPHYKGKHQIHEVIHRAFRSGSQTRAEIKCELGIEFRKGQIYAIENQFPRVFPTVDIGVVRENFNSCEEVLLIKRADTGEWCLPGGFVDPSDKSFEAAAKRELHEECGVDLAVSSWSPKGTFPIDDWRYRSSRDKIITSLFKCYLQWGVPKLTPEAVDFRWSILPLARIDATHHHSQLVEALFK